MTRSCVNIFYILLSILGYYRGLVDDRAMAQCNIARFHLFHEII